MTNVRKILIVDDDAELREALVEQLALHEEFQAIWPSVLACRPRSSGRGSRCPQRSSD